jgi:uncharacterized OB-fold protein
LKAGAEMTELTLNTKSFFSALDEGKLIGSRCKKCGYTAAPQRVICPKCHADQMELIEFSGKGKLAAYTVIYVPSTEMQQAGYDGKNPYCVGIVVLDEGPRVNGQILGLDLSHPEQIQIGTQLKMTTVSRGPEGAQHKYLAFEV